MTRFDHPAAGPRAVLVRVWLLALLGGVFGSGPATAAEIWLGGVDPFVRQVMKPGDPSDYLALFDDDAPWPRAASHVRLFKTSTQYLLNATDDDLRRMIGGLKRRGIGLAFEALMIPRHEACGLGIEGYSAPGSIGKAAERVRRLGGVIEAVAMDEPLWFGHHAQQANACGASIEAVARGVAENVAALRAVFPAARVGEIEPLDLAAPEAWAAELDRFADAYQSATGTRLDFVHADLDWNGAWRPALASLARHLHARGTPFGIIYNGDPEDDSDVAWTAHATSRFETVEADPTLMPDQAILQTWMLHPTHMLPETQDGTMTSLVVSYIRPATHLTMQVAGDRVTGRLTAADGTPIAGARVVVMAEDASAEPVLTVRHLTGVVPTRAVKALLALRLNAECDCSGTALVRIGKAEFRQRDHTISVALPTPSGAGTDGDDVARFEATPETQVMANWGAFSVTAEAAFDLSVPVGARRGSVDAGYLALIFLDSSGVEFQRRKAKLVPSEWAFIGTPSDGSGWSTIVVSTSSPYNLKQGMFLGDQHWRGVALEEQKWHVE